MTSSKDKSKVTPIGMTKKEATRKEILAYQAFRLRIEEALRELDARLERIRKMK